MLFFVSFLLHPSEIFGEIKACHFRNVVKGWKALYESREEIRRGVSFPPVSLGILNSNPVNLEVLYGLDLHLDQILKLFNHEQGGR